jgi:glycosyltransferase involved in cell wall biosynthesis
MLSALSPPIPPTPNKCRTSSQSTVYRPSSNFHGSLNNQPLIEKLGNAHVLVVPSSYEGFGIVYLEGMCFGLPAIGTTAGAAGEIIEHGKTGYLIEPNDSQSLANHLAQLASDRDLLTQLSLMRGRDILNSLPGMKPQKKSATSFWT